MVAGQAQSRWDPSGHCQGQAQDAGAPPSAASQIPPSPHSQGGAAMPPTNLAAPPRPLCFQGNLRAWDSAKLAASAVRCPCLSPGRTAPLHPITKRWGPKLDYKLFWNKAPPRARASPLIQMKDLGS